VGRIGKSVLRNPAVQVHQTASGRCGVAEGRQSRLFGFLAEKLGTARGIPANFSPGELLRVQGGILERMGKLVLGEDGGDLFCGGENPFQLGLTDLAGTGI
jgi:hypothetical protein